jgi:hypothetical protein
MVTASVTEGQYAKELGQAHLPDLRGSPTDAFDLA